jgi:hypothetical protein
VQNRSTVARRDAGELRVVRHPVVDAPHAFPGRTQAESTRRLFGGAIFLLLQTVPACESSETAVEKHSSQPQVSVIRCQELSRIRQTAQDSATQKSA